MINIMIGCDPDSKKHGISIWVNGQLKELCNFELLELMDKINELYCNVDINITMHIENVTGVSNSGFHHKQSDSISVRSKKSENIGLCKQSQIEVERLCKYMNVPVVHHKISSAWKKGLAVDAFKRVTGWGGRSNEETRSAAWFGYLGTQYDKNSNL